MNCNIYLVAGDNEGKIVRSCGFDEAKDECKTDGEGDSKHIRCLCKEDNCNKAATFDSGKFAAIVACITFAQIFVMN